MKLRQRRNDSPKCRTQKFRKKMFPYCMLNEGNIGTVSFRIKSSWDTLSKSLPYELPPIVQWRTNRGLVSETVPTYFAGVSISYSSEDLWKFWKAYPKILLFRSLAVNRSCNKTTHVLISVHYSLTTNISVLYFWLWESHTFVFIISKS